MTEEEVRAAIEEIRQTTLRRSLPAPHGSLTEALDSMALLQLVVAVEDRFEISFEPEDEAAIKTLDDLVRVVLEKQAAAHG